MGAKIERETRHHIQREDLFALRYIVHGPAGAVSLGLHLARDAMGRLVLGHQAEVHTHAYRPDADGWTRDDCDILHGGRCAFNQHMSEAAAEAWVKALERGDDELVWRFLERLYADGFNVETPR